MSESNQNSNYQAPNHSFNIEYAQKYGVHEAILIHHFQHWIEHNQRTKKNFREGRTWTFQTFEEIAAWFPYFTADQIRDLIHRLCEGKNRKSKREDLEFEPVLMKGNFNRTSYDKTTWYAFKNEKLFTKGEVPKEPEGKSPHRKSEMPTPIPDTKKDTKTLIDRFDAVGGESDLSMDKEEQDLTCLTPDSKRTLVFASKSPGVKVVTHPVADLFRKYLAIGFSEETIKEAICKMLQKNPKLNGTVEAYFQTVLKNTQNNEKKLKRSLKNGNKCTKPSNKPSSLQREDRKIISRIRSGGKDEQE